MPWGWMAGKVSLQILFHLFLSKPCVIVSLYMVLQSWLSRWCANHFAF